MEDDNHYLKIIKLIDIARKGRIILIGSSNDYVEINHFIYIYIYIYI